MRGCGERARDLAAAQRQMNECGRSARAQGEPVSGPVRDDEGAIFPPVKAGPVTIEHRPEAHMARRHELPAMGVSGNGERDVFRVVESVRMVREQDGKGVGLALGEEFAQPRDQFPGTSHRRIVNWNRFSHNAPPF